MTFSKFQVSKNIGSRIWEVGANGTLGFDKIGLWGGWSFLDKVSVNVKPYTACIGKPSMDFVMTVLAQQNQIVLVDCYFRVCHILLCQVDDVMYFFTHLSTLLTKSIGCGYLQSSCKLPIIASVELTN